jgi:hypothetical protein
MLPTDIAEKSIAGMPAAKLFPNPNQGSFYVEIKNAGNTLSAIELYSSMGKLLGKYHPDGPKTNINTTDLPNGLYFVRTGPRNQDRALKMVVEK